jgi:hypothetical protein
MEPSAPRHQHRVVALPPLVPLIGKYHRAPSYTDPSLRKRPRAGPDYAARHVWFGLRNAREREKLLACPSTRNGSHLTVTGQSSQILINALLLTEVVAEFSVSSKGVIKADFQSYSLIKRIAVGMTAPAELEDRNLCFGTYYRLQGRID